MDESDHRRDCSPAARPLGQLRARLLDDAIRGVSAGFGERMRMEAESALEWNAACGGGQGYPEDSFETGQQFAEGNEHRIFQTADGCRALKLTRPPNYGARGSLLDYLDNLVLNNFLTGDDLRVEGIVATPPGPQLIVSQPWIQGVPATTAQITEFFEGKNFESAGENAWYSRASGIRIFDARTANIIFDSVTGYLIPIDIHISAPPDVVDQAWAEQKRREALPDSV